MTIRSRIPHALGSRPGGHGGVTIIDLVRDALTSVGRSPVRSLLCTLGTIVAVAAIVTTNGLGESARGAVAASFNVLRANTVYFSASGQILTEAGVSRLAHLHGVAAAGLMWDLDGGQPLNVATSPEGLAALAVSGGEGTQAPGAAQLSFTVSTPEALRAIDAKVGNGRLFDAGADSQHRMVALLGATAASQLGIVSVVGQPAIFVGHSALTVIGIVNSAPQDSATILNVIVSPYVASVIGMPSASREVIVRTRSGAAQLIGRQGPYALAPYSASDISSEVPPDPSTLRQNVEASLSTVLSLLAVVGIAIGLLAIMSVTTLSVVQRRSEIGLRRAIGYFRSDIARLILAETVCIGTIGGLVGAAIGVFITSVVASANQWIPVLSLDTVVAAPLLGVAIGLFAGIYPAARAMKVTPLRALRSG